MKAKLLFALFLTGVLAAALAVFRPRGNPAQPESAPAQPGVSATLARPPLPAIPTAAPAFPATTPAMVESPASQPLAGNASTSTNRAELLAQLRERFRALAAGDPTAALLAAKHLTNEVERETALLALVTEWTQGELGSPRQRASAVAMYGLEAGLGMELARNPELALLWANEMTEGPGRAAVLQQTAIALLGSDPAAAFALSEQVAPGERRQFYDAVFAGWAAKDTDEALRWAEQMLDPGEHDAALQAIRSVAPVGIGAALSVQEGYPVINELLPGTPAELSGQLHKGDRIVALAQGDAAYVDTRGVSLQEIVQMVRGAPGTLLQLQVLPAEAAPDSLPQTIAILRGQIKFKR